MEMPPAVIVEVGNGQEYPVSSRVTYIGTGGSNQIVLADNGVSEHHAKITFADGEYHLENLDGADGTFVNDRQSNGRSKIVHGDLIRLGSTVLEFKLARHAP
jgi:pSer/pThr/pTyr-binding forkhead associated (FHA) protein